MDKDIIVPRHIVRLVLILVVVLLLAVTSAHYLTDSSFYRFGHYRADAVPMLASDTPQFEGSASCRACHRPVSVTWSEGIHVVVQCEVCHGTAAGHPDQKRLDVPTDTVQLCTLCHEAMPSRPDTQPQIVVNQHPYPHEQSIACTTCHNPHSPSLSAAPRQDKAPESNSLQVPAMILQCASCHGAAGQGVGDFPGLAGREVEYLAARLRLFRSGELASPIMNGIAAEMDDNRILELAEYYSALPNSKEGQQ